MKRTSTGSEKWQTCGASGFTLIEVTVALAMGFILLAGVYGVFNAQQKTYIQQNQVREMQEQMRAGLACPLRDVRIAGHGVLSTVPVPLAIVPVSAGWTGGQMRSIHPVDSGTDGGPDEITLLYADYSNFRSNLQFDYNIATDQIDLVHDFIFDPFELGLISDDIGSDLFQVSAYAASIVTVTNSNRFNANPQIVNGGAVPNVYKNGQTVVSKAKLVRFWVDDTADPPVLMMENYAYYPSQVEEPIADNIVDMQIRYFISDGGGDRWEHGPDEDEISDIERVEINLVGTTSGIDRTWSGSTTFTTFNNTLTGLDPEKRYRAISLSFRMRNPH